MKKLPKYQDLNKQSISESAVLAGKQEFSIYQYLAIIACKGDPSKYVEELHDILIYEELLDIVMDTYPLQPEDIIGIYKGHKGSVTNVGAAKLEARKLPKSKYMYTYGDDAGYINIIGTDLDLSINFDLMEDLW